MRKTRVIAAALMSTACIGIAGLARPAPAPAAQQLVDAAYRAMGGADVAALKTATIHADLYQWDPGESYSVADPEKPDVGVSHLVETRDYVRDLTFNAWDRPKNDDGKRRVFTEVVTPQAGWAVGNNASNGRTPKRAIIVDSQPAETFSGRRLTVTLREIERLDVVREMKAHPDLVSAMANQMVDGKTYPAARYRSPYGTFIVMFDPETHLPARVRTPDWDALEGDSVYDVAFSNWHDVAGVKIAFDGLYTLNGMKVADLRIANVEPNPKLAANLFAIPPDQLAHAAKPADPRITPFHWVIRRQFSGFYFDSDTMYGDDGTQASIVDVAPNVSETQGWTHNTVFIDMGPYLAAMEAPNDDGQAIVNIGLAHRKYPGKPIKYLVLSHHHVDHVGGMRQFAAEGATIVVGKGDGDYFRRALARPYTLDWNAPKKPFHARVIEVDDTWTLKEGGREVDFYAIDNPHAADMLMGWVPADRLGLITDLWIPGPPPKPTPGVGAVVHAVESRGLSPAIFAGGHGSVGNYAQAAAIVHAAGL
jgi:glyoxylase-like metal-dependent hydrolase (beta-lactamase superfamily II)